MQRYCYAHFTDKETDAQRDLVTYSKTHSLEGREMGFKPWLTPKPLVLQHNTISKALPYTFLPGLCLVPRGKESRLQCPHFTDEETEGQRGKVTSQVHTVGHTARARTEVWGLQPPIW